MSWRTHGAGSLGSRLSGMLSGMAEEGELNGGSDGALPEEMVCPEGNPNTVSISAELSNRLQDSESQYSLQATRRTDCLCLEEGRVVVCGHLSPSPFSLGFRQRLPLRTPTLDKGR